MYNTLMGCQEYEKQLEDMRSKQVEKKKAGPRLLKFMNTGRLRLRSLKLRTNRLLACAAISVMLACPRLQRRAQRQL